MESESRNHALRVYLTTDFPEPVMSTLSPHFEITSNRSDSPASREELITRVGNSQGVLCTLNDIIDREIIDKSPKLTAISTFSAGYEHIDVEFATLNGVYVTNTPDVLTESTADLTIALMLAVSRRVVEGHNLVSGGMWDQPWSPKFMLGTDLNNKVLGIIGFGRIGRAVARRALAFGMRIRYFGRSRAPRQIEKELRAAYTPLETLLVESDFVSVHLPLTGETRYLINAERLRLMKRSAYLVNTSRGPIVDENALADAIFMERIAGAALDVFQQEPLPVSSPLLKLENVVVTPHLGSATRETRYRMGELAASNLRNVLLGIEPLSLVNPEVRRIRPLAKRSKGSTDP